MSKAEFFSINETHKRINDKRYKKITQSLREDLIWFGLVLWHIYNCRLYNAKSGLYSSKNSIQRKSTKLNVSKYCCISVKIELT